MGKPNQSLPFSDNPQCTWPKLPNQKTQAEYIKKQDSSLCWLHLTNKGTHTLKVKEWKKIFSASRKEK